MTKNQNQNQIKEIVHTLFDPKLNNYEDFTDIYNKIVELNNFLVNNPRELPYKRFWFKVKLEPEVFEFIGLMKKLFGITHDKIIRESLHLYFKILEENLLKK